jgi:hypothetical protein
MDRALIARIGRADWPAPRGSASVRRMSRQHIIIGFGLLAVVSGLGVLKVARPWIPAITPQVLCVDLGWRPSPARLVTQVQAGAAALLRCPA